MRETVVIRPEDVLPTVLSQWERIDGTQVKKLARELWTTISTDESLTDSQQRRLEPLVLGR